MASQLKKLPGVCLLLASVLAVLHGAVGEIQDWPRIFDAENISSKAPIHIILVQPYSGGAGTLGFKIEPMVELALEHIAAHPTVLPDHRIVFHAIDSGCSESQALDKIFDAHISPPVKFGVFGAACTGACKAANVMSRSFKTVNFAQLCTGSELSDEAAFPNFARFAPDLGKNSQSALDLSTRFNWNRVALVTENVGLFVDMADRLASSIRDDERKNLLLFEKVFPVPDVEQTNQDIAASVDRLIDAEVRVVLFVGYEKTLAQTLCEAYRRGFVGSEVVFIYATFWINKDWWREFASDTRCTQEELLAAGQGLLGVDRLRLAPDSAGAHGGSGLLPSEIMEEYHRRCEAERPIPGDPAFFGCSDMHSAYTYDAAWGWAFTLDRWLATGHLPSQLNYLDNSVREQVYAIEVEQQDFSGLTGRVRHFENGDRDGQIQLFQLQGDEIVLIANIIDKGATFAWEPGAQILWGGEADRAFALSPFDLEAQWVPSDTPLVCPRPLTRTFDAQDVIATEACESCPGGFRFVWDDEASIGRCFECEPGRARATGSNSSLCDACPIGFFANASGATACLPCPAGHICDTGTVEPLPCSPGEYAPEGVAWTACAQCEPGSYASMAAMSECMSCGRVIKGSTSAQASRSSSACLCPEEFFRAAGAGDRCDPCPEGMACPRGSDARLLLPGAQAEEADNATGRSPDAQTAPFSPRLPVPLEGFMTLASAPLSPYACVNSNMCPGGGMAVCAVGRDPASAACGRCLESKYMTLRGTCDDCQGPSALPIIVAVLAGLGILSGIAVFANKEGSKQTHSVINLVCVTGLTLSALQTLGLLRQLAMEWFEPVASIMSVLSLFTFDLQLLHMSCMVGTSGVSRFLWQQLAVLFFGIALLGFIAFRRRRVGWRKGASEFLNSAGSALMVFFISLMLSCASPLVCYQHPPGQGSSMIQEPAILCNVEGDHLAMVLIGLSAFLLILLPFITMVIWATLKYQSFVTRSSPASLMFLHSTRFLFLKFTPERYYYGIMVLTRSLFVCLIPVVFAQVSIQVITLCAVLSMYAQAQQYMKPWRFSITNFADGSIATMMLLVIVSGALVNEVEAEETTVVVLGSITFFSVLGLCCFALFHSIYRIFQIRPYYHAFICHHKADAAAQARLLKMFLDSRHRKHTTFIDSDYLVDLDKLFDVIKVRVGTLITYLTRDTLTRPWCAGEITTAHLRGVETVGVRIPSFVPLTELSVADLGEYIDMSHCNLLQYRITFEDITNAYSWFHGFNRAGEGGRPDPPAVKWVELRENELGSDALVALVDDVQAARKAYKGTTSGLLGSRTAKSERSQRPFPSTDDMVVLSANANDYEACAAAEIIVRKINSRVIQFAPEGICNLTRYVGVSSEVDALVTHARAIIVVLSRGSLESLQQLSVIMKACPSEGGTVMPGRVVIPVSSPGFKFPTPDYFDNEFPRIVGEDFAEHGIPSLRIFFKMIAIALATHASDSIIEAQADAILHRLKKAQPSSFNIYESSTWAMQKKVSGSSRTPRRIETPDMQSLQKVDSEKLEFWHLHGAMADDTILDGNDDEFAV